jgi:hypothetical protein
MIIGELTQNYRKKGERILYLWGVFDVGWLLLVIQCYRVLLQLPRSQINNIYDRSEPNITVMMRYEPLRVCEISGSQGGEYEV